MNVPETRPLTVSTSREPGARDWGQTGRHAAIALCTAFLLGFAATYVGLVIHGEAGPKRTDFVPYYAAGRLVTQGSGSHMYETVRIGRDESALVYPLKVKDGVMPFLYPAYFAAALAPLSLLPYNTAFLVWLALNCTLLVIAMLLLQAYSRQRGSGAVLLWFSVLSFLPVLLALAQGQVSILLLAVFCAVLVTAGSGRDVPAGALLALALIKPPYVLPLLVVFALRRRWRLLGSFVVSAAALIATPVLFLGHEAAAGFIRTMVQAATWKHQVGGFEPRFNQGFAGGMQLLLPEPWATVGTLILDLIAVAVLIWATRTARRAALPFAAAITVALLVAPHVLLHDLALLVIPAVVLLTEYVPRARLAAVGGGYVAVVVGLPLAGTASVQLSAIAIAGLLIAICAEIRRQDHGWVQPLSITSLLPASQSSHFISRKSHAER